MITGDLKSQIDKVWEAFWAGGKHVDFVEPIKSDAGMSWKSIDNDVITIRQSLTGELQMHDYQ